MKEPRSVTRKRFRNLLCRRNELVLIEKWGTRIKSMSNMYTLRIRKVAGARPATGGLVRGDLAMTIMLM